MQLTVFASRRERLSLPSLGHLHAQLRYSWWTNDAERAQPRGQPNYTKLSDLATVPCVLGASKKKTMGAVS